MNLNKIKNQIYIPQESNYMLTIYLTYEKKKYMQYILYFFNIKGSYYAYYIL